VFGEVEPAFVELLDLNGDPEEVSKHGAEPGGAAGAERKESSVEGCEVISEGESSAEGRGADACDGVKHLREAIGTFAAILPVSFEFFRDAMFAPGEVEERDRAMVEKVEEFAECEILVLLMTAFDDESGVVIGEDTGGAGESHEGDDHAEAVIGELLGCSEGFG
jgi:hypothetical protein